MNNKTAVKLKTISMIENEKVSFYIDAYQRGYRWTKVEVKDLLQDILDFSQTDYESHDNNPSKFYCLQPIIVTKNKLNDTWKVIDGQQRLTTLYLIYLYYINTEGVRKHDLPFKLHYNGKPQLEKCFMQIQKEEYYKESEIIAAIDEFKSDIDCYFVLSAYKEIVLFFDALDTPETRNQITDMKRVFDNFMKVIWYELIDCDEREETSLFTKINVGKIPLTNAELIKALLLHSKDGQLSPYQDNLAITWDEIEAQLSDENFWGFLANDKSKYSTRIDFIFEIMATNINESLFKQKDYTKYYIEQIYNQRYFSFYVFNNYVRYLVGKDNKTDYVKEIWSNVTDYFNMFKDWYQNRKWYHLIGYVITLSGKKYVSKLCDLSKMYLNIDKNHEREYKSSFEEWLREEIRYSLDKDSNKSKKISKHFVESYVEDLQYGKDNDKIKNILLLYNISFLELLESQTDARFPFDKYKNDEINWDIEHINAVATDRPTDLYDREENACLIWLNTALNIPHIDKIKTAEGISVTELINSAKQKKLYLDGNDKTFVTIYETIINYFNGSGENINSISNLTILDSGTNRSYKNDVFPIKRRKILENCTKEIFIPLCTRNIFLKAFIEADNLIQWGEEDGEAYQNDIVEKIATYLKLEE